MSTPQMLSNEGGSILRIWLQALTKPREADYAAMASLPGARATTACLWVFVCSFAPALVGVIVRGGELAKQLANAGLDTAQVGGGLGPALINFICIAPFAAVLGVAGFLVSTAIMQGLARMFGGQGTFDQFAYTLGAITAPGLLVSALLTLPAAVPFAGACFGAIATLFGLYVIVLEVTAIKGVHHFGWGQAIGTFIIPGLAVGLICCCVLVVSLSVMGMAMGDVWNTINRSLLQ